MNRFVERISAAGVENLPFIWKGEVVDKTYGDLFCSVRSWSSEFGCDRKQLVLVYAANSFDSVAAILGAWKAGHAVMLVDPVLDGVSRKYLEKSYRPGFVVESHEQASSTIVKELQSYDIEPGLSLMLSTSGSTGSPKYVRLSEEAVESNALAISESLKMDGSSVAAAHLQIHYSYGWSIVSSHLISLASICFCEGKMTDASFWKSISDSKVSHFPGVPTHYDFLLRMNPKRLMPSTVSVCTQAGGRLSESARRAMRSFMELRGGEFVVMYGQTEAGPRMSTLQHSDMEEHILSVGKALSGGVFSICSPDDISGAGEVVYSGNNVMMGYSYGYEELAAKNELDGVLRTGDIGYLNDSGFLHITGRMGREAKVHGLRVNLDEVESMCLDGVVVLSVENGLELVGLSSKIKSIEASILLIGENSTIPTSAIQFSLVDEIPLTSRGKVDYLNLRELINESK